MCRLQNVRRKPLMSLFGKYRDSIALLNYYAYTLRTLNSGPFFYSNTTVTFCKSIYYILYHCVHLKLEGNRSGRVMKETLARKCCIFVLTKSGVCLICWWIKRFLPLGSKKKRAKEIWSNTKMVDEAYPLCCQTLNTNWHYLAVLIFLYSLKFTEKNKCHSPN